MKIKGARSHRLYLFIPLALFTACSAINEQPVVTPSGNGPRLAANHSATERELRTIASAEATYAATQGGSFGTLKQLAEAQTLDPQLGGGEKNGYRFEVRMAANAYQIVATPVQYNVTGLKSFYLDSSGVIHAADKKGLEANESDPAL